jgi:hypothetical protein
MPHKHTATWALPSEAPRALRGHCSRPSSLATLTLA